MLRSLVIDALEMAWQQRRPAKGGLLFHSDRGSQYASEDFSRLLDERGITASAARETAGITPAARRCSVH